MKPGTIVKVVRPFAAWEEYLRDTHVVVMEDNPYIPLVLNYRLLIDVVNLEVECETRHDSNSD